MHVEERLGRDGDARALGDERAETALVCELHVAPLLLKLRVVRERLECAQPVRVLQPAVADARGDELREAGIAHGDEPARRDAVGHVAKFSRPQLGEIAQHGLLQQLGVELRDAVDRVAADAREVRHAHVAWSAFVDEREPRESRVVAGKSGAHFVEEATIDLEDDLEMPRKQRAEEIDRPLLQRLGEQRVIRVGERRASHRPRFVPAERVFVHEQAHQLRDGDRGVRVVELHGPFFVEGRRECRRSALGCAAYPATSSS